MFSKIKNSCGSKTNIFPKIINSVSNSENSSAQTNSPNTQDSNKMGWFIIYISYKWYQIVKCLDEGRCKTTETAILTKNGIEYHIKFKLYFSYNCYDGMKADDPKITFIYKNNMEDADEDDWKYIVQLIKQKYKNIN